MFTELIKGNCMANRKRGGAMKYCAIKEAAVRVVYMTRNGERRVTRLHAAFPGNLRTYDIAAMVRRQKDPEIDTVVYWSVEHKMLREGRNIRVYRNELEALDRRMLRWVFISFIIPFFYFALK